MDRIIPKQQNAAGCSWWGVIQQTSSCQRGTPGVCPCCSHCASLSKSFCSVSQSEKCPIGLYRIQSSAKSRVCDDTAAGKSLINLRKRRCRRTDPWGTPLTTGSLLDDSPSRTTCCILLIGHFSDCETLQNDLDKLAQWEQQWGMQFHPSKCNSMSVTRSKTPFKFNYTHCASLSKSFCSVSQSEKCLIGLYRIQSSAKSRVCDDTAAGKSLINVRKRRDPRTDPWGTPLTTGSLLDDPPSRTHPSKCNSMSVTRSKTPFKFNYILKGHTLESVDTAKYLGITISSNMTRDI
jgi:hypothetical protein